MYDIYTKFQNILRQEYVDIDLTKEMLKSLKDDAKSAGPQFEHFRLACLNNLQHKHAIAIDYANRALGIAKIKNDVFLLEKIHTLLGFIAYNRGNYEKCINHYLSVLNYKQSPRVLNNIGVIFDDFGDIYESYRYYLQAEEYFDDPLNFRLCAIIHCNIAECEISFAHYSKAEHHLELAKVQIQKFTKKEGSAYLFNTLGNLASAKGNYDLAVEYFSKGEDFSKDESFLVYYRNFILNHAKALYEKGDLAGAKNRIELFYRNSENYSFDSDIPEAQELLAKIADSNGEFKIANQHYKKYINLIKKREEIIMKHRSESIKTSIKFAQLHTQLSTLHKMSKTDALTGLANRFALREYMDSWSEIKNKSQCVIALFDIDNFKLHNDRFGHSHGDECLIEVAKILTLHLTSAFGGIFRYGGDEFLVTLIGCNFKEAYKKLNLARQSIESLNRTSIFPNGKKCATISCSIGAVLSTLGSTQSFEELFDIADRALYISKDQGRNQVTLLSSS